MLVEGVEVREMDFPALYVCVPLIVIFPVVVMLSFASNGGDVDELTAKFCGITLIETLFETPDKQEFTEQVAV